MEHKPRRLAFRVTKEERQALDYLAAREGLLLSDLLRGMVRDGFKRRGLPPPGLIDLADYLKTGQQ